MIKRAIRYLRISTDRQSNYSISGQDIQTRQWCERNDIVIADTFTDEGFSARNFDRPDMKRLYEFVEKNHKTVQYLVVNDFTRFSRDAGEALVQVKALQKKYQIKIASAGEGVIVDYDDPGSFFYAGLRFLQGEDEINRNRSRINLGIFTAKKHEGRYLGKPPIGYKSIKDNQKSMIVIDETKAPVIRYIFNAFLSGLPLKNIRQAAVEMGLGQTANSAITDILKNFVYTGLIRVKAYKDNPEQLVEGIHEPIISRYTFSQVQEMMKPGRPVVDISDNFPLRSVLLCHCGLPVTGAPSRGRSGKYYNYYKCKVSGHNNFNAEKAHAQLLQVMEHLSLPQRIVTAYSDASKQLLETEMKNNQVLIKQKKNELYEAETRLISVEGKWIADQLSFETYQRWYTDLTNTRIKLKAEIEQLGQEKDQAFMVLLSEITRLSDMKYLYESASTLEKQELIRLVFDRRLYYKDHSYRTPYLMQIFEHNTMILNEKGLLIVEQKSGLSEKVRSSGAERSRTYNIWLYPALPANTCAA